MYEKNIMRFFANFLWGKFCLSKTLWFKQIFLAELKYLQLSAFVTHLYTFFQDTSVEDLWNVSVKTNKVILDVEWVFMLL